MEFEQDQTIEEGEGGEQATLESQDEQATELYTLFLETISKRNGHTEKEMDILMDAAIHMLENPSNSFIPEDPRLQESFNEFLKLMAYVENNPGDTENLLSEERMKYQFESCKPFIIEQFQRLADKLIRDEISPHQDGDTELKSSMHMLYSYLSEEEHPYERFIDILGETHPRLRDLAEKYKLYFKRFTQEDYKQLFIKKV